MHRWWHCLLRNCAPGTGRTCSGCHYADEQDERYSHVKCNRALTCGLERCCWKKICRALRLQLLLQVAPPWPLTMTERRRAPEDNQTCTQQAVNPHEVLPLLQGDPLRKRALHKVVFGTRRTAGLDTPFSAASAVLQCSGRSYRHWIRMRRHHAGASAPAASSAA
jgi:hypothetical protein